MSSRLLRLAVSCNTSDLTINLKLFRSSDQNMFGKLSGRIRTNITVHKFAKYKFNFTSFAKLVNYCCYLIIFCGIKSFSNFINFVTTPVFMYLATTCTTDLCCYCTCHIKSRIIINKNTRSNKNIDRKLSTSFGLAKALTS